MTKKKYCKICGEYSGKRNICKDCKEKYPYNVNRKQAYEKDQKRKRLFGKF